MARAQNKIEICSRASLLMGGDAITAFSGNTAEEIVADAMYDDVVVAALTNTRWRFATTQATLTRDDPSTTLGRFDASYDLPASLLMLHAITVNDHPIKYDIYNTKVFTNASENDVLIADYTFYQEEQYWPAYFTIAVEFALAAVLATSVARDQQLANLMEGKSNVLMAQARRLDSQSQTSRKLNTSRFIAQRRS